MPGKKPVMPGNLTCPISGTERERSEPVLYTGKAGYLRKKYDLKPSIYTIVLVYLFVTLHSERCTHPKPK